MVAPIPARRRAAARAAACMVAGLAAAAVLTGCSSLGAASATTASGGTINVSSDISEFKPGTRAATPQLSGTTLDGKAYSTSYNGHVTVLNVWGAWCTACREEASSFAEASKKYAPKGVQFLGIDTMDPSAAQGLSYDSEFGIGYPSLQDPQESLLLQLRGFVSTADVPATLIVDSSGKVAFRAFGAITEPELDQGLDYALSGSGS